MRINFDGLCSVHGNQSNVFSGISEIKHPMTRAVLSWLSNWLSNISSTSISWRACQQQRRQGSTLDLVSQKLWGQDPSTCISHQAPQMILMQAIACENHCLHMTKKERALSLSSLFCPAPCSDLAFFGGLQGNSPSLESKYYSCSSLMLL